MRKQTKLVAVASAAALLAIGASMTSFAATGWVEEGGEWFYYDKDGNKTEDEWKKSGDKWFWLDSEESGAMALDKLIEDGDNTYYVDSTGAMVSNTWVKVVNEEQDEEDDPAEYNYYYMQSNGKAYKTGDASTTKFKTIDGKRYSFDENGKMLYGWVNGTAERLTGDDDWASPSADVYYMGNWDDGAMKTGWQKIYVSDAKEDEDKEHWFYFNSNGKRFFKDDEKDSDKNLKTKKINGKTYGFDERGVMVYEWNVSLASDDGASPSEWSYFNSPEDGARVTKGWFKVVPANDDTTFTDTINVSFDQDGADDEDNNWYYADGNGKLYANAVKKIKGKYYAFNENGKMLNGLVFMSVDSEDGSINKVYDGGVDSDELDKIMDYDFGDGSKDSEASLYYFGNDADADGSMKTGNVVVNVDGDSHNFVFSKTGGVESRGKGVTGIEDTKYIYQYGKRIKASSDEKYIMVAAVGDTASDSSLVGKIKSSDFRNISDPLGKNSDKETVKGAVMPYVTFGEGDEAVEVKLWLVNTSGAIVKNKTAAKDGDDWYFFVKENEIMLYANNKNLKKTEVEDWKKLGDVADVASYSLEY